MQRQLQQLRHLINLPEQALNETISQEFPGIERVPTVLNGEPIIKGTRTSVRAIVERWKFGESPEEIVRKLPHLRLAQVFNALAYYDDHRDEIEHYITVNQVPVND